MMHDQALLPTYLKGIGGWCDPALENAKAISPPKAPAVPMPERRDSSEMARPTGRHPQTPQQQQQQKHQRHQTERAKPRGVTGGTLTRTPSPPSSSTATPATATTKSATAKPRRLQFNAPQSLAAELRNRHTERESWMRSPATTTTGAYEAMPLLAAAAR
ncbi:hypothetical protein RB595_006261 [Gaeumannomyces hyphopodioides]